MTNKTIKSGKLFIVFFIFALTGCATTTEKSTTNRSTQEQLSTNTQQPNNVAVFIYPSSGLIAEGNYIDVSLNPTPIKDSSNKE